MARYKDLYTPASNYGQVYRGGLRQRTEAQEKTGQNMVDFAGDIYNLVDRQRQRKAQEEEQKSLERERASLQASRKVRNQLAAEEQGFNLYSQKLRNAVTLYKDEEDRLDSRRYKRYGGREQTSKAFDERYEKFTTAMSAAMTDPQAQRAVLHEFRDLIPEFQGAEGIDVLDDKVVGNEKLNTFRPMSKELFMEKELDKSVGGNQFRDLIRSLLMHPTYGVPFAVEESEKTLMDAKPASYQETLDTDKLGDGQTRVSDPVAASKEQFTDELDFAEKEGAKISEQNQSTDLIFPEQDVQPVEGEEPGFADESLSSDVGEEEAYVSFVSDNPWFEQTDDNTAEAVELIMEMTVMASADKTDSYANRVNKFNEFTTLRSDFEAAVDLPPKERAEAYRRAYTKWLDSTVTGRAIKKSQKDYFKSNSNRVFELLGGNNSPGRRATLFEKKSVEIEGGLERKWNWLKSKLKEIKAKGDAGRAKMQSNRSSTNPNG